VDQRNDVVHRPQVIGDVGCHRGSELVKALVLPNEVVENKVQRQSMAMVLNLFRDGARQPREPPHAHPHGQIVPLCIGRAHMLRVRIAGYPFFAGADAFSRAVFALAAFPARLGTI
jgi:hypothetical protein